MSVKLPGPQNRLVVVGQTGTGKSVAGVHHLWMHTEAHRMPWLVFDPKGDDLIRDIGAERLPLDKPLPKKLAPRLYRISHVPETSDDDHVESLISQAINRGKIGMYFDEGYSIPKNSKAFRRALTQGRSKQVPTITLSQRPVSLDKFVFTEASMYRVFYLLDKLDRDKIRGNTGIVIDDNLKNYFSHWYDVGSRDRHLFEPGPDDNYIRGLFADRKQSSGPRWI